MTNIHNSIIDTVGHTPLVKINTLTNEGATIVGKVEFFNPGGSVKDRIAKAIVDAAQSSGELTQGGTIVEATSGNTGIALAMIGAAHGFNVVLAMPSSMSAERITLMRAYGAELVLTDPSLGMRGAVEAANNIVNSTENAVLANQFENEAGVIAHRHSTGEEIWNDTAGQVDIVISGVGTGGTITGVGEALKAHKPSVQMIAVEPAESPLLTAGKSGPHMIQGIGANFIPHVLDLNIVDQIVLVSSEEALECARNIAAREGILVGISSGAALAAAAKVAEQPDSQGKMIVAILPDTGERYLSTKLFNESE